MSASAQFNVTHVAQLARLGLTEQEKTLLQAQLRNVLQYIEKLKQADTNNVELTNGPNALFNVVREDNPHHSFTAEEALANAPHHAGNLFIVPRVIE
jgi:aspartyl-tRNA(Asn)/glutamyl-tRNA(Gln) amidotransferase subunit C